MRDAPPTQSESEFFQRLLERVPMAQDWFHADNDGTPWMTASVDEGPDGSMTATWRVDFDGSELVGGRSPANLNWDDGMRGRTIGMSLDPPDGFTAKASSPAHAAVLAAEWFIAVTDGRAGT